MADSASIVLGLGGTVDYEIAWDSVVLEAMILEHGVATAELDRAIPVDSERDLLVTLLAFLRDGVGGERFVATTAIIESFAQRFRTRVTLGGTCVRATIAMRALGVTSTVHLVSIDDTVRRLLPAGCSYLCSASSDSTDPHLIVQFAAGARIVAGDIDIVAPHANRIIYTNDPPNRELVLSRDLGRAFEHAEIIMISGFNVIQEAEVLDARLDELLEHLASRRERSVVFFEDAGYHRPILRDRVREKLVDAVDVWSMNEDELQAYVDHRVDLLDPDAVIEALIELRRLIPARVLVVHTKYWSLAAGDAASDWERALRGGITMATTRYRCGDGFTELDYRETGRLAVHRGGALAARRLERLAPMPLRCIPAFVVDTGAPTTIGLGDAFVGGFIAALAREGGGSDAIAESAEIVGSPC